MFAKFEIRRINLSTARKLLGTGIGMCPKEALFKKYIELEIEVSDIFFGRRNHQSNDLVAS